MNGKQNDPTEDLSAQPDPTEDLPAQPDPTDDLSAQPDPVRPYPAAATDTPATERSPDPVWSAATAPAAEPRRGPRSGTLILGLVLALCGAGAIAVALGYSIDLQLATVVVLVVAALTLLIVPLVQRGRREGADAGR